MSYHDTRLKEGTLLIKDLYTNCRTSVLILNLLNFRSKNRRCCAFLYMWSKKSWAEIQAYSFRAKEWEVGETGGKGSGQNVMEGIERKSYSAAVIEGVRKRARVFVGDSIVRKTDRVLNKGDDVVVCLPGAKIEAITERVKNIVGSGKGGSVLVHVGKNNVEREGTTAIVRKYRQLVRTLKQTRVEQVILSGILPVMGRRGHKYRNCRGMAINMLVQKLCREEEVGFVDLWGSFFGRDDMYMKVGLHLSGKGRQYSRTNFQQQ